MADSTTPNLGLVKPEVGASDDTWGDKTNNNWDKVDSLVATKTENSAKADKTYVDSQNAAQDAVIATKANTADVSTALAAKASLDSPAFSGNPTAPNPLDGDNDTTLATTAFVQRTQGISQCPYIDQASYTFAIDLLGKTLRCGPAVTGLVIPAQATVAWPWGARIDIMTQSDTELTVTGAAGVTVYKKATSTAKLKGAWSVATIQCIDHTNNQWVLFGDLVPA